MDYFVIPGSQLAEHVPSGSTASLFYFEVDDHGLVTRQVEVSGDSRCKQDEPGNFLLTSLDRSRYSPCRVSAEEFHDSWSFPADFVKQVHEDGRVYWKRK